MIAAFIFLKCKMATKSEQIRLERLNAYRRSLRHYGYSIYESYIDPILHYMHEHYKQRPFIPAGFRPNILEAVKGINHFAANEKIRFEDALMVLHEYANSPVPENTYDE